MTDNYKGAYSINTLVKEEKKLNIPIYQRLFVWEEEQINLLLNDLYNSFSSSNEDKAPYYIGIITVVKNKDKWDVVDGQQRLTFLSLFGAFSCSQSENEQWKEFLFTEDGNNELRIHYTGRPEDCEDLKKIAEKKNSEIQNNNFRTFLECIQKFKEDKEKDSAEKTANNWNEFADYVYKKASFLISELPENYAPEDLNLFFEKMNATGRQLTAVEQIKGKYFPACAATFDACLNFEKAFDPSDAKPSGKLPSGELPSLCDILKDKETKVESETESEAPNKIFDEAGTRSILSPEVFLLHCLEIAKNSPSGEQQSSEIEIPHDERKILETFKAFVGNENGKLPPNTLLDTMKEYRKWLDANIIYLEASSDGSWEYSFRKDENADEEDEDLDKKKMKQFQSMLYVSSSNYQEWVLEAYRSQASGSITLKELQKMDNNRHPCPQSVSEMTYQSVDRYWFWKLDYLLWERIIDNNSIDGYDLKEDEKTAIRNYKFRRNRSVEHLHPQTDGGIKEWDGAKHHFGNLAMISSSFNSFQQNDSVGVKFARLQETQIPNKNLESIKLLLMFKFAEGKEEKWTIDNANKHGEDMCDLLKQF